MQLKTLAAEGIYEKMNDKIDMSNNIMVQTITGQQKIDGTVSDTDTTFK